MRGARGTRKDGYVLVAVLGVMALLSSLVIGLLLLTRNAIDTAAIASSDLADDAMTQSAISLAGYQLFLLKLPAARVNGQQLRLNDGVIALEVSTDAGKVDLNGAGKALLAAAYKASGLQTLAPEVFAARVIDWRDADGDLTKDGAEAPEYGVAGVSSGPRDASFRSIGDLAFVLGVSAADVNALAPFVTIYNPAGRLDVFSAPGPLIAALPGVDADIAALVEKARATRNPASIARLADLLLVQSALIDAETPKSFRIRIDARRTDGRPMKPVELVMSAGATPGVPYQILDRAP